MSARDAFLAGERPDDVALYLSDSFLDGADALAEYGDRVEDGVVLVVDGERGRSLFKRATGMDAMAFAREAMDEEARVDRDLSGGACPESETDGADEGDHGVQFVFAFVEAQNEEAGGLYAEGPVVHAYAYCDCGTAYSDRWVAE